MTEPMSEYGSRARATPPGWATGFIVFAAVLMIMTGVFQALEGLAAIFENEFYVVARNYLYEVDVTAWGWIHLVLGILLVVCGWALFARSAWAGVTAIVLAGPRSPCASSGLSTATGTCPGGPVLSPLPAAAKPLPT